MLTPALEEPAEEAAPSFEEEVPAMPSAEDLARISKPEEYQEAVAQMRSAFKDLENALRQEIASLRQEVETLRARLKE